ncbi:MAG: hypothetical protein LBQ54_06930 [Planctomycetaceae bacterium]|nr:hypothetical protein [Planctomycetaceae bacterium]
MPPAANARALDPSRLTLTPFGSPSNRKSFHLEAEGYRMQRHIARSEVITRSRCSLESIGGTTGRV